MTCNHTWQNYANTRKCVSCGIVEMLSNISSSYSKTGVKVLTYDFLREFYLRANVYGNLAEFNKQFSPQEWEQMRRELVELISEI